MIRKWNINDKSSITIYLASKLNISISEANRKVNKILKSGVPAFILEGKDPQGICWIEQRIIDNKKENFIEILCNNWRLAEDYIQILRWNLCGMYWFSLPKHDFLNRTYNKNGIRFMKVNGQNNIYCYKFEKRNFFNYKSDDNEE